MSKGKSQAEAAVGSSKAGVASDKILTPEARQRLNNLKMVKPEFADQIEMQLIQMAQTGKLPIPFSDAHLKGN